MTPVRDLNSNPPATGMSRRRFLQTMAMAGAACALGVTEVGATPPASKRIKLYNTHTLESLDLCYCNGSEYEPEAMAAINAILRDHRSGEVHPIEPALIDLLWTVRGPQAEAVPIHIISGFRSRNTNNSLRRRSKKVASRSLHLVGKAADIRLPNIPLKTLRQQGIQLKRGGVGYYPDSNFVHLDIGRVRYW